MPIISSRALTASLTSIDNSTFPTIDSAYKARSVVKEILGDNVLRVVTVDDQPWSTLREDEQRLTHKYFGYTPDILRLVAQELDFDFEYVTTTELEKRFRE